MPLCPHCREDIQPRNEPGKSDEPVVTFICPNCDTILGAQIGNPEEEHRRIKQSLLVPGGYHNTFVRPPIVSDDTEQRLLSFVAHVDHIAERHEVSNLREEAIQVKIITPLIEFLGWNRMTPEVEFEAWVGPGQGSGDPDYALCIDGERQVLIEAKQTGKPLQDGEDQLHGYLTVSAARVGILSNGKQYRLYEQRPETGSIQTLVKTGYQGLPAHADQFAKVRRDAFER